MEQEHYERWMLMLLVSGILLSVAEFLVISLVVGKGTILGFMNGLLAGGSVVVASVVLIWIASFVLRPGTSAPAPTPNEPVKQSAP